MTIEHCQKCGTILNEISRKGLTGIRCPTNGCEYNFDRFACPKCEGKVFLIEILAPKEYEFMCENSHFWMQISDG